MQDNECDFLVIGSGLAGLAFALKTAMHGKVIIVSKTELGGSNTEMAQGGIAAVVSREDSFEKHIHDTLVAGAGLCRPEVVKNIIEQAPQRIRDLQNWGVSFDVRDDKTGDLHELDLTHEGGHSDRRVLHFEDQTGREIHRKLLAEVTRHPNIEVRDSSFVIDLILNRHLEPTQLAPFRCLGAYVLDQSRGAVNTIKARATVLATGGAGKVYLYTSNWDGATGDGIAMAFRAGARVANLEFMQFHPTCLFHPRARNFLISEALRGEGAELTNAQGEAFMQKYHPRGSLAPRDIVARSIDAEMKASGSECVYLDTGKHGPDFWIQRFPAIHRRCLELGIDISREPIPVVPAAHYLCGGILTDVNGRTDIAALFAIGETACTGLHGANRLASNSLLECIGMAHNCAQEIIRDQANYPRSSLSLPEWISPTQSDADELVVVTHMWEEIRRLMWNYVGIVRSNKRLQRAHHRLTNILDEITEYYSNFQVHNDILELRNIAVVAELSVRCALKREESRGIHYNLDFPKSSDELHDSILFR